MGFRRFKVVVTAGVWVALVCGLGTATAGAAQQGVTVGNLVLVNQGLVGVGRLPANLRDAHGETFGSISGLWSDPAAWSRQGDSFSGVFFAMPDRGYNIAGTIDYIPRINRIDFLFTPAPTTATGLGQNQLRLTLTESLKLFETTAGGQRHFFTGLDPVPGGLAAGGARIGTTASTLLPQAHNGRLSLDAEGIVRLRDGSWLISDEYGPSLYRFSADGQFLSALPVAAALQPIRNGVADFSSNNPAFGQPAPTPANPTQGRQNNQGFEGLTVSPDGHTLFVALQSATRQDGGAGGASATRHHTRLYTYDLRDLDNIQLTGEYVVVLPRFVQQGGTRVAAQSEILALSSTQLLILARDSNGFAVGLEQSLYRSVDVIDLAGATNIHGTPFTMQVAPGGVLNPAITPAQYLSFLNVNNDSELARFGLANGNVAGLDNLSEKWEGLVLLPALDPDRPHDWFLFVANDNDFATTDGFHAGTAYRDAVDIDTMFLVYRVAVVPEPAAAAMLLSGLIALGVCVRRRRPQDR